MASLIWLGVTATATAQWQIVTYDLNDGWNAIYLHGEATYAPPEELFASGDGLKIQEIWRWNPNSNQVQFTNDPLLPSTGTEEWSVWYRNPVGGQTTSLTQMLGQSAYLVRCSENATVPLPQRPLPPTADWVRNGANLLGFPTKHSSSLPSFTAYFASFPAALASDVFKYTGGDLSATNPQQIFAPNIERLDRNQAYWFESQVVGNFYAPVQITLSKASGIDFGRTGSLIRARILNRTSTLMSLNIEPVASNAPPPGQELITGPVPLIRRTLNASTASWEETPIQTAYNEEIPPQSAIELSFGIDRAEMTGAPESFYASLLRFTDADNLFDILIPATARKASLAGLWMGEAKVTAVESKAQADAVTPTGRAYPLRYLLHVADDGTARILSQVFLGALAAPPHSIGICTSESLLKPDTLGQASRVVTTHMPLGRVLDGVADSAEPAGSGAVAIPGTLTRVIRLPFDDPTNPFVHQYHPDHDNRSPAGAALPTGAESYDITREVRFAFTASPPTGSGVTTGWGSNVIGGIYTEVIDGLHKDSSGVGTGDGLQLSGTFELRRVSELGSISVTP